MKYYMTRGEIFDADTGMATLGHEELRDLLAKLLTKVPAAVVHDAYKNCIYLMPAPERKGVFIPNRVIEGKHIIMFPHALLSWPEEEQINVVLHETAHYVLGHKSPLEDPDLDYERQEEEAWAVVNRWLKDWSEFARASVKP